MVVYTKEGKWRVIDPTFLIDETFDEYKEAEEFNYALKQGKVFSHRDAETDKPVFV